MIPSVTIAITRHNEPDGLLLGALDCLLALQKVSATVFVMDQLPSSDIEKYCAAPSAAMSISIGATSRSIELCNQFRNPLTGDLYISEFLMCTG